MSPTPAKPHGTQTPLASRALPRRSSPENWATLRHLQSAHDASLRASRGSGPLNRSIVASSSGRDSSGESHATGQSDAKKWFDQSNQNPTATFDSNAIDVDPPFFQKESDSSNEDKSFPYEHQLAPTKRSAAHSSSADDYRSVIDDLTIEIQKLKGELKRYKQRGPGMLQKDKLFEIKIHGLPKRKRRELESTLRDFAAGLENSPDASSSQHQKSSRQANRDRMYSGSRSMSMSMSKHASSSSGSNIRPVDSAYASVSIGAKSTEKSFVRQHAGSQVRSSEQKVESYLRDIPEGLYPRHMAMTERDKKQLVVRRLEQIFTGKIAGRHAHLARANRPLSSGPKSSAPPGAEAHQGLQRSAAQQSSVATEPAREARILPHENDPGQLEKKGRSQDMGSASNSHGDQTESGGTGNGTGNGPGTNTSPSMPPLPEQRPTRPRDLDPDRVQIPSENMEYIKHLGLVPPELARTPSHRFLDDVLPDAEGWVYLNLLCNMAQLHIMNVTPDFVRNAVTDFSAKFQLSPDGRKIRWRGGTEGTKFSSNSSGGNSQHSPQTDDAEDSNKDNACKRQKTGRSTGGDFQAESLGKKMSEFGPRVSGWSEGFHYKPLFGHQGSPNEALSMEDDTMYSFGPVGDSNGDSRWGQSGSGASNRLKRRHDGAIIYYSGAPFCTDLSGDPGSPTTYMLSSGQEEVNPPGQFTRPLPIRSESGSSLNRLPLSDMELCIGSNDVPESVTDVGDDCSEISLGLPWCHEKQYIEARPLVPCGLGGVLPEDHFMVVVTTRRPMDDSSLGHPAKVQRSRSEEATEMIVKRLATMSTSPGSLMPRPSFSRSSHSVKIEYLSGRIERLPPVPLPPPAIFFPPFSIDSWSDDVLESEAENEVSSEEELMSRRANPHQSDGYPDGIDFSSGDEDGEEPDDEPDMPSDE